MPNFVVHFQAGYQELAERAAESAEQTRSELYRSWFGEELQADWNPKCEVFIHTSAQSFAAATEGRATSSGYSITHAHGGRVVSQRIDLLRDSSDMIRAVLPHELAHVLLTRRFIRRPLPLWAEEGLAVLAETPETKTAHLKNFDACALAGTLYSAQQLMTMREYPADHLRGMFYAQSVSLVDFLIRRAGAAQFMEFLTTGGPQSTETALQRIYGLSSFQELNQLWLPSTATPDKVSLSR